MPFHLLTKEFYTLVKSRLTPGGVVVQNIEPSTMLFDSAAATLKSVFPSVDLYDGGGNVVAVGYEGPSAARRPSCWSARPRPRSATRRATTCAPWSRTAACSARPTGKVMTDDFAPVETHARDRAEEREVEGTDRGAALTPGLIRCGHSVGKGHAD